MSSVLRQIQELGYADLGTTDKSEPTLRVAERTGSSIGANVFGSVERLGVTKLGAKGPNTYGGVFGLAELPLHTDLAHWFRPPRYVLLRCIDGSPYVSTRILDRSQVEREITPKLMQRAVFSPRRPLDGKLYLLRMLTRDAIRWDDLFLIPKNAAAHEVKARMASPALTRQAQEIFLAQPGRAILLDNWRVLHGRSAVPKDSLSRQLDRVYLDGSENGNEDTT